MFDADRPIQKSEQDRLQRVIFSKYFARSLLDHTEVESLTIGLYGKAGAGKTSIINLILEELLFARNNMFDEEKPILMYFNIWNYTTSDSIVSLFLERLISEIYNAEFITISDKTNMIKLLQIYSAAFYKTRKVKMIKKTLWKRKNNLYIDHELNHIKTEINDLFLLQKHKFVIFIDNVSLLSPKKIAPIFQMIKAVADFSKTIFVVAFDKTKVAKVLNEDNDYFDKLFPFNFTIPDISPEDLENILFDRLYPIIKAAPIDSWDVEYWADIYYSTLKFFFETPRDVTRFINLLNFSYLHVAEIVNPIDFIAITAIEIFEPEVYAGIRENKDLFVDLFDTVYKFDKEKLSEDKLRLDEIFNRAKRFPREMIELLCVRLFPRLLQIYEDYKPFYHSETIARKYKRICTYDLFEVYFRLSIPSSYITFSELNTLLALTKDEEGFQLALLRLNQDNKILKFLDALDSVAVHQIPLEHIPYVMDALIDAADLFPPGIKDYLHSDTYGRIHRIIHQLLNHFNSSAKRFDILANAIKKSVNSLYIIVHEITMQGLQHDEEADVFVPLPNRDVSPSELLQLKSLAIEKIIMWAKIGRLIEHPKLVPILFAWILWGNPDDCKRYVQEVVGSDRGILAFLTAALKEPIDEAMNKEEMNPEWQFYLKNIESFISIDTILKHTQILFKDEYFVKLNEREQLALLIFLNLAKPDTVKSFGDKNDKLPKV